VRALQTASDSTRLSSQPGGISEPFSVTLDQDSFRSYRTDIPSLDVGVTKENLLEWYKQMATMRRMEQAADALYRAKQIRGFCHLAIGQVSPKLA
jgi:pyruvate dehydrogenase E1 component alpha subunit